MKLLLAALGETPSRGKERLFAQIVQRARSAEARPLSVLDEAHWLDADSLTDLRLLVRSALEDAPPLKRLLVGQHALAQTLRQTALRDLLDRITVRYHLHPWTATRRPPISTSKGSRPAAPAKSSTPPAGR